MAALTPATLYELRLSAVHLHDVAGAQFRCQELPHQGHKGLPIDRPSRTSGSNGSRERGVFEHQLAQWREDFYTPIAPGWLKEKALADVAALLVLQKFFQALLDARTNDVRPEAPIAARPDWQGLLRRAAFQGSLPPDRPAWPQRAALGRPRVTSALRASGAT